MTEGGGENQELAERKASNVEKTWDALKGLASKHPEDEDVRDFLRYFDSDAQRDQRAIVDEQGGVALATGNVLNDDEISPLSNTRTEENITQAPTITSEEKHHYAHFLKCQIESNDQKGLLACVKTLMEHIRNPDQKPKLIGPSWLEEVFKGEDLHVMISHDAVPFFGIRAHLIEVISNLIQNAREANPDAERRLISLHIGASGNGGMEVSVTDNGPGIAVEDQSKLFAQKFTTKSEGTGTGLGTARETLAKFGGVIRLVESGGEGTVFSVSLLTQDLDTTDIQSNPNFQEAVQQGKPLTVLIMDDNLVNLTVLRMMIANAFRLAGLSENVQVLAVNEWGMENAIRNCKEKTGVPPIAYFLDDLTERKMPTEEIIEKLRATDANIVAEIVAAESDPNYFRIPHMEKPVRLPGVQEKLAPLITQIKSWQEKEAETVQI